MLRPLCTLQNRAVRLLQYSCNDITRSTVMAYKSAGILPLRKLFIYRSVLSNYFTDEFLTQRIYSANTRPLNHYRFTVPRVYTLYGYRTRSHIVPSIFNELPVNCLDLTNFAAAKRHLKRYLLASL